MSLLPDIYWVERALPALLALMPRPRSGDWLSGEVAGWRRAGIDTVVSLLEPQEARELLLEPEEALCRNAGIEFLSFPVPDHGVPRSVQDTAMLAGGLADRLRRGIAVAVHCHAGVGRSALICGCVLHALGVPPREIFPALTRSRGYPVPETDLQESWLVRYVSEVTRMPPG